MNKYYFLQTYVLVERKFLKIKKLQRYIELIETKYILNFKHNKNYKFTESLFKVLFSQNVRYISRSKMLNEKNFKNSFKFEDEEHKVPKYNHITLSIALKKNKLH